MTVNSRFHLQNKIHSLTKTYLLKEEKIAYSGNFITHIFHCRFHSNDEETRLGFQIEYNTFTRTVFTACGGNFSNSSGILTFPSYPRQLTDCVYLIAQPNGTYVNMSLLTLDVDYHRTSSFIEMRDGQSEESPVMRRFYRSDHVVPAFMQTTQNHLWLR